MENDIPDRINKTPEEIMQERIEDGTFKWATKPAYLDEIPRSIHQELTDILISGRAAHPEELATKMMEQGWTRLDLYCPNPTKSMRQGFKKYYNYDPWEDEQ